MTGETVAPRRATRNPRDAGQGERGEAAGVFVHNVEVWRVGQPRRVRAGLGGEPRLRTPHQCALARAGRRA